MLANAEADEFATWWNFARYVNFPHVLGLIYEFYDEILELLGDDSLMNGFMQLQKKLVFLCRLAKEDNYMGEIL